MDNNDIKSLLPVHVILGAGVYARIKTNSSPRIGKQGEPVAMQTKLGLFILSPGEKIDMMHKLLTQTSQVDYEELCKINVLGLADTPQHDQGQVYSKFWEQLSHNEAGWYETSLPWKVNHPQLPTNKHGGQHRLKTLRHKLRCTGVEQTYGEIIKEQSTERMVEAPDQQAQGVEFYHSSQTCHQGRCWVN